jgi:hypothetical protein
MTVLDPIREDGANVSRAWRRAFVAAYDSQGHEAIGLAVEIRSPDQTLSEDAGVRARLDTLLDELHSTAPKRRAGIDTVSSTIFPRSMWNPKLPRQELFLRYERIVSRLKKDPRNSHGTYFARFLEHDQLDHVIGTRVEKGNRRRSAYQLSVFDPSMDHGHWRQRGFPCLHQVSLVPDEDEGVVHVFAYYATQTMLEKAYGNYLGLWNLGLFVAHYWGLRLSSLTCIAAVAKAANDKNMSVARRLRQELDDHGP